MTQGFERAAKIAEKIMTAFLGQDSPFRAKLLEKERLGAYIHVVNIEQLHLSRTARFGRIEGERAEVCMALALEKVTRLLNNPDHLLSRESQDLENDKYPGAVRGKNLAAGTSGLPADHDEIVSALVLVGMGDLTFGEAMERLSGNEALALFGQWKLYNLVQSF